jgi:hypothetical protein
MRSTYNAAVFALLYTLKAVTTSSNLNPSVECDRLVQDVERLCRELTGLYPDEPDHMWLLDEIRVLQDRIDKIEV